MTDRLARTPAHTTGVETLAQIRSVLAEIARDLDTLHQIEKIQQQHQVVLASVEATAARLCTAFMALQQALTLLDHDTVPHSSRARSPQLPHSGQRS